MLGGVFNATFNNISVISCGQLNWWGKPEYSEKTTDLSQVTDKQYRIYDTTEMIKIDKYM